MTSMDGHVEHGPQRIDPIYATAADGKLRVYAGELELRDGESAWLAEGDLILNPGERPGFSAHFAGEDPRLMDLAFGVKEPSITVPGGATLQRSPIESVLVEPEEKPSGWVDCSFPITQLETGDVSQATRIILHINGQLSEYPLPGAGDGQGQLTFQLGDWSLRIGEVDRMTREGGFTFVVEAVPQSTPIDREQVEPLIRRVFMLLRFVAGGGISVGPRIGLDSSGEVVWAWWGSGRMEASGLRWCPDKLVNSAVPKIADGITALMTDPGLDVCVDRAISLLLATNENGVLDTRIPVACSGLELLAWAVLQHRQGLSREDLEGMSAGGSVRRLLDWAGVDTALPGDHVALATRLARVGQRGWAAPEVVFNVRNALVHPPKRITDPEWPAWTELVEAWQLSTWYLDVALLRVLGYEGEYTSRLRLTGWKGHTEPLPWVAATVSDGQPS